jgi:hypothetical protein
MRRELPDRSEILFGREPDLAYLLARSEQRGITAVVGRAQMGKSWLLTELARQLSQNDKPARSPIEFSSLMSQPTYLVGFAESVGETADMMLRAVVDLYSEWLSDSSYREQAQVVYQQQSKDLVGKAGEAVGIILEKISKLGAKPLEAVGGLVKEAFEGLANANRELVSGGTQLPRLQVEQGRDLLALLHKIKSCHIVLVFDQWEKSPGIEMEGSILDSFLRHLGNWPPCHIFLGVRSDEKAQSTLKRLQEGFPGAMEVYNLQPMHLDETSGAALLAFLRDKVYAAVDASDVELLEIISGYPGTVSRWTSPYYARRLDSLEKLKESAVDANSYRFAEFDVILPRGCYELWWSSLKRLAIMRQAKARKWKVPRVVASRS